MTSIAVGNPAFYPTRYHTGFDAIEHWGSSGSASVSGGVFTSSGWSPDDNHTTAKGGFGRIYLLAFRQFGWDEEIAGGLWVCSNFTNAKVKAKVRGVSMAIPSGHKVHWLVQARHPTLPNKYLNYVYSAVDLSAKLLSGNWETIETTFKPDQSAWSWGKGDGIYDTFGSIEDTLRNVTNTHLVVLGPDGSSGPTGAFEMEEYEILYNRNGPQCETLTWNPQDCDANVTLSNGNLTATVSGSGFGGVRGTQPMPEGEAVRMTPSTSSAMVGVATISASINAYLGTDAHGWGWACGGGVWHNATQVATVSGFTGSDELDVLVDSGCLYLWKNGAAQNGGAAVLTGLPSGLYPAASDSSSVAETVSITLGVT